MKRYDEIANNVFERRDKYIAIQKRKKQIMISIIIPALCCCIIIITGFGLHKSGFFGNGISVSNGSKTASGNSDRNSSADGSQNRSSNENSSQNELIPKNSTPSNPDNTDSFKPSDNTPSDTPPVTETDYFIDSLDKINFYSAKKIISEKAFSPFGMRAELSSMPKIFLLNNIYSQYPIDRNKVFTTTMVTYFTVRLNDKNGFLAHKLGGTGLAEVVVTENNIESTGQMITFKKDDKYYTCFMNGQTNDPHSNKVSREFSTHKYIDRFNIVKNLEQENYKFTVHYDGSKVVGFTCSPANALPTNYVADNVTFIDDYCVVLYTKQTFTIDELEIFFQNENTEDIL